MLLSYFPTDLRRKSRCLSYLRTSGKFHSLFCLAAQQFLEPNDATHAPAARISCRTPESHGERKHNKDNVNKQARRIVAFVAVVLYVFDSVLIKNYSLKSEQKQFLLKNSLGASAWVVSKKKLLLSRFTTLINFLTKRKLS